MNQEHIVDQHKWCDSCKYNGNSEWDSASPCYDCMYDVTNVDTDKPVKWVKKEAK